MRRHSKYLVVPLLITGGLVIGCWSEPTNPRQGAVAPLFKVKDRDRAVDSYIVVLVDTVSDVPKTAGRLISRQDGTIRSVYRRIFRGFSVSLPTPVLDRLRSDPAVRYIQQVSLGRVDDHTYQLNAPWNLDRVDQRTALNSWYSYSETGSGVRVYIVDTGIRTAHTEFGGRASIGVDVRPEDGQNGQDCNGHGTHVSGTVGGSTYGVAKSVSLIAVRVVMCSGFYATQDLLDGLEWVSNNHIDPAVINMSLGGPADNSVDSAVAALTALGITVVVSAGNEGQDACNKSPARAPEAITVGATRSSDARWVSQFFSSNFGTCVDLFAPGVNVLSAWNTSNTATKVDSGTSMAAPHVAGAVARFLQFRPTLTPTEVTSGILSRATQDVVVDPGTNSPNLLLYTRFVESSVSSPTITSCGTYTWSQTGSGIGSTFTYGWQQWVQTGLPPYGGFWGGTVSGQSYTTNVCPGDNTFHLRATATNEFGMHGSAYVNGA